MIEPGSPLEIEACGQTFQSVVLSRKQQRQLISLVSKASKLDAKVESIDELYDITDQMIEMCLPDVPEKVKDNLQVRDALEIANVVLVSHILDTDTKKKSESQPTSERE